MTRNETRSLAWTIFDGVVKLIFLLLFIFVLDYLKGTFNNTVYTQVVDFLKGNLGFLVVMNLVFFVGDMLFYITFPVNLIFPWVNAVGSILVISFIFKITDFIGVILNEPIFGWIRWLGWIIYPIVFIATLIGGYIRLTFRQFIIKKQAQDKPYEEPQIKDYVDLKPDKKTKSWGKIRKDFIDKIEELVTSIRNTVGLNKKKRN